MDFKESDCEKKIIAKKTIKREWLAFLSFIISICFLAGATIAWQSMNKNIGSNGIVAKVSPKSNLVISKSNSNSGTGIRSTSLIQSDSPFAVSFDECPPGFYPCTHDDNSDTGLKRPSTLDNVDIDNGTISTDSYVLVPVLTSEQALYYYDYTVYIASAGAKITPATIYAQLDTTKSLDVDNNPFLYASSIDFYVAIGSSTTYEYKDTLNIAGLDKANQNQQVTQVAIVSGIQLSALSSSKTYYISVRMRCYFDGNLMQPGTGKTYVRSSKIDVDSLPLCVTFSLAN